MANPHRKKKGIGDRLKILFKYRFYIAALIILLLIVAIGTAQYYGLTVPGGKYYYPTPTPTRSPSPTPTSSPSPSPSPAVRVTRTLPAYFAPNQHAVIYLNVAVDESKLPVALGIEDHVPDGWYVINTSHEEYAKIEEETRTIGWIFWKLGNDVRDVVLNYTVIPNSTYGGFSGIWLTSRENGTIISVCTPGWKCMGDRQRGYQNPDCSWSSIANCFGRCVNGMCGR